MFWIGWVSYVWPPTRSGIQRIALINPGMIQLHVCDITSILYTSRDYDAPRYSFSSETHEILRFSSYCPCSHAIRNRKQPEVTSVNFCDWVLFYIAEKINYSRMSRAHFILSSSPAHNVLSFCWRESTRHFSTTLYSFLVQHTLLDTTETCGISQLLHYFVTHVKLRQFSNCNAHV